MRAEQKLASSGPISRRALVGLQRYRYHAGGYSLLDHLHNPIWNWLVDRLPMWLAPNLITLVGTIGVILAYLLSMFYVPNFSEDAPRWVYWTCGLAVFLYVNLDCMDGKQARRTKTSSPLGQLFDHGCDALSLSLLLATVRASMQVKAGPGAVIMEQAIMIPWLLAHWEEYHSGVMLYGNGYFGVLEGNYALVIIHFITAIWGPAFWAISLPFSLPGPLSGLQNLRDGIFVVVGIAAGISAVGQLHRVLVFPTAALSQKDKANKDIGNGAAGRHLVHLSILTLLGSIWMAADVTHIHHVINTISLHPPPPAPSLSSLSDSHPSLTPPSESHTLVPGASRSATLLSVVHNASGLALASYVEAGDEGGLSVAKTWLTAAASRMPQATFGLVYATVALQLILAHMSKEPFLPYRWAMGVLALGTANSILHIVDPLALGPILLLGTFLAYSQFVVALINQICAHLGIKCLTI